MPGLSGCGPYSKTSECLKTIHKYAIKSYGIKYPMVEKSVYYKDWHVSGIKRKKALLNSKNKFISYHIMTQKVGRRFPFSK